MYTAFTLLVIMFLLLFLEKLLLDKSIRKIPIRILVNGTRGKSTVVKYIASLLRQNNIKTIAKITGVIPTLYNHDGSSSELKRRGGARVTEQFEIIRRAASVDSEAIVIECMSINPELQQIESRVLKPQFYIITNIREDHLEEMGKTHSDWINSICSAIPYNSIVFTSERVYKNDIERFVKERHSKLLHVDDVDFQLEEPDKPVLILDNLKIALLIARELNLNTEQYLKDLLVEENGNGIQKTIVNGKTVNFVNAFAVNDVPSAEQLIDRLKKQSLLDKDITIIFNSRSDRPFRSIKFARWLSKLENVANFIVTGDNVYNTVRAMTKLGVDRKSILKWKYKQSKNAKESLKEFINNDCTVIGIGNIKGSGFEIIKSLNQ